MKDLRAKTTTKTRAAGQKELPAEAGGEKTKKKAECKTEQGAKGKTEEQTEQGQKRKTEEQSEQAKKAKQSGKSDASGATRSAELLSRLKAFESDGGQLSCARTLLSASVSITTHAEDASTISLSSTHRTC